jgi:hypothetical protein
LERRRSESRRFHFACRRSQKSQPIVATTMALQVDMMKIEVASIALLAPQMQAGARRLSATAA